MVWEINMGACPRLEFDNIMFINCLGYGFHIYGAFEFAYIANKQLHCLFMTSCMISLQYPRVPS